MTLNGASTAPMLEVVSLSVGFNGTAVVSDVDVELAAGESLALWGSNGAGKTTVLRAVMGLIPFKGTIRVGGLDVAAGGHRTRHALGYVPQRLAFYDDMSSLGLLEFLAGLRRVSAGEARQRLEQVDLGDQAAKAVGALSGGMRQRLALAAALLGDPPLLLLDEPTANLDVASRNEFMRQLVDLRRQGKSMVVTSHRLDEVTALADRVLVLENGRVVAQSAAHELETLLYPTRVVRLSVPEDAVARALDVLIGEGFEARRNGHGLLVTVPPGQRARPVAALLGASVPVDDMITEDAPWDR